MYVISDNSDTYMGFRLTGVGGEVVHTKAELEAALDRVMADNNIAILLINGALIKLLPERIGKLKLEGSRPLVVEIPDRHGKGRSEDAISEYIRGAVGIEI